MSRQYVPGQAQIFTGTGGGGALEFLGTTESGATIQYMRGLEPVMADLAGTQFPFDVQWMGQIAFVRFSIRIFNWDVLDRCQASPAASAGALLAGEMGTPILASGNGKRLLVNYPYAGSPLYPNMPLCRNFHTAILETDTEDVSTRAQVIPMVWVCHKRIDPATGAGTLFDLSRAGMPAVN